ncbi:MAG: efflux transporter outer membrane subunit [Thermoguttaceae bacterium]
MAASLVLAATQLLVGCGGLGQWYRNGFKVGPDYSTPPATAAEHWIDADNPRLKSLEDNNACWWTAFNDPTLDCLVASAADENLTLRTACYRILEARAQRGVAAGNLFPQQQAAGGSYTRNALGNGYPFNLFDFGHYYDNATVGFNAAWELDFWGRLRRAVEAADANLDAQCANYNNVLVLLQAEVAANYIQMRAYEERLQLARKNVDLQKETLRIISLREQKGLVTELDVQQATYNLGQTESMIPPLDAGRRRAQNHLCILMAKPPQELEQIADRFGSIPVPPQEIVVGIPAELLRRRPDVQQAERAAAAQSAQIGIAEAEFYPHIAITGTIGLQAEQLSQLFESKSLAGQIGPGFTWNLLNYGRIRNNVKAQDARFQQAVLTYRDTVLRANEEVEDAIVAFLREQDRAASLAGSAKAAARSVELASRQYETGLIAYQPLLDSERVLVAQQDTLAESRGLIGIDLVAVYKALGGGWRARLAGQPRAASEPVPAGIELQTPVPAPQDRRETPGVETPPVRMAPQPSRTE